MHILSTNTLLLIKILCSVHPVPVTHMHTYHVVERLVACLSLSLSSKGISRKLPSASWLTVLSDDDSTHHKQLITRKVIK